MNNHSPQSIIRNFCLLALFLINSISASGQKVHLQGAQIPSFSAQLSTQFSDHQVFQINTQALSSENQQEENFILNLQLGNNFNWEINLTPSQIISPNYREIIGTQDGPVILPSRKNIAYTGYVSGTDSASKLTLDQGWLMGFITLPDGQRIYIEPLGNLQPQAAKNQYLVYSGEAVINNNAGGCGALQASNNAPVPESQINDPGENPVQLTNTNCKEVDFSVASAFDMINSNHDTPELVMNHIISITNMMQTYFEFMPIEYLLNDNYVSATPAADPFGETEETNTNTLLPGFVSWAQNSGVLSEHDVAQVWTARNIEGCGNGTGLVGCAYINTICNNSRYNICEDYVPNSIKTLSVLSAHELGHNWNCLHSDRGDAPFNIMNGGIQGGALGFGPNSMTKIMDKANSSDCLSGCEPPEENCTAQSEFPFQEWIEDVQIGQLVNSGSGKFRDYSTAGYSDYTDLVGPPIDRSNSVPYLLNAGFSGANPGDFWTVFIDYNQNNIFDLPEEEVVRARGTSVYGAIGIPSNALNGISLVRIILSKEGYSGPCDNPAFGEVEDYLIEIEGIIPPPELADLTVSDLSVGSQAYTEMIVGYTINLSNIGVVGTGDFSLGVYLSSDFEQSPDDILVGEIPTGNFAPGYVAENVQGSFSLAGITPGDYILIFKIDKDDVITESLENNNTAIRNFRVFENDQPELPDLALSGLTITSQAVENSMVPYSITVSNIGLEVAENSKFGVFISPDDQFGTNDQLIEVIDIDNLDPFETQEIVSTLDINGGPPGDYFIFFKIDKEEVIEESQESNNTIQRNFTIIEESDDLIDLELSMTASVTEPDRFTRSRITLTLTNNSTNQATNIRSLFNVFSDEFVVAGDGDVTITGGGSFSTLSGFWRIPSLVGGATATVSFDLFTLTDNFDPCAEVTNADQPDVDSTPSNGQCPNAVEDDEANLNTIIPPVNTIDFFIQSLDIPFSGISSTQSSGDVEYGRFGNQMGNVRIDLEFFLSTDEQLDTGDTRIGGLNFSTNDNSLNSTASVNYNLFGVEPGFYTLIVVFDRLNKIDETNETNNIAFMSFTVEEEVLPDCSTLIGGDEILCSENIGDLTRLYIREGNEYFTADLDQEANIVATSPSSPLVYDSTLINENIISHKLADGTITMSGEVPTIALDFIPNPTAATLLTTGEYLIAGNVPLGEVGQEPYGVDTRVLKLSADLSTVIDQNVISSNSIYPANLSDEVFTLIPLEDGLASIIYRTNFSGVTTFPILHVKDLDLNLNEGTETIYLYTFLNGITETPCGNLLLKTTEFRASLRGGTNAKQEIRISKDGRTESSFWSRGITRADRFEPNEFANFTQAQDPGFFSNTYFPEDNPPAVLIGSFPLSNGDTTEISFPYFEYNYGTRNGDTGIFYGNLNGQITAVTNCVEPPEDGVDIALDLMVSDSMPEVFSKIFYQVTVVNQGTETATGLSIDFDYGAQANPRRLALVNNPNPDYSAWQGIWTIGTLAAGEARTFELEVFVLPAAGPSTTLIAELRALDQVDVEPMNNLSLSTIFLDSGATLSEGGEAASIQPTGAKLRIDNLFPNPAKSEVTVAIHSEEELEAAPLQVFDAFGKLIHTQAIALEKGTTFVRLDIHDFSDGIYLVVLPKGSHQNLVKRFVKMK